MSGLDVLADSSSAHSILKRFLYSDWMSGDFGYRVHDTFGNYDVPSKKGMPMDNNQLGRNIQHLRLIHSETLDELGNAIHCARSTVKGYENGSREPDLQKLQLLALHYNIAVDELLRTDLTGLGLV